MQVAVSALLIVLLWMNFSNSHYIGKNSSIISGSISSGDSSSSVTAELSQVYRPQALLSTRASVSAGNCLGTPATTSLPNVGDYAIFTSPNYPSNYPPFTKCGWKFTTVAGNRLSLSCDPVKMSWFASLFVTDGAATYKTSCFICSATTYNYDFSSNVAIVGLDNGFIFKAQGFNCFITAYKPTTTACACGVKSTSRIVGGVETTVNEYPWMAAVVYTGNLEPFCGGTLLSDQFVLTAAHCTHGLSASAVEVRLGLHSVSSSPATSVRRSVLQIIEHPSYSIVTQEYDMALLRFAAVDLTATSTIKPVCLPTGSDTYAGVTATVAGWGHTTENGVTSDVLREVDIPVVTLAQCQAVYGSTNVTVRTICAGQSGLDSCQGDSGGPLMFNTGRGYEEIIGVVSWGVGCGRPDKLGVYTRVTALTSWIIAQAGSSHSCAPPS